MDGSLKIRWREHEMMLVIIVTVAALLGYCWQLGSVTESNGFYTRVFWPKVGLTLLFFLSYLGINRLLIPSVRKITPATATAFAFGRRLMTGLLIMAGISFVLALGANIATYYARPYEYSYKGFNILALFGYNDQPLNNLFAGFGRALGLVAVVLLYSWLRELVIERIENRGAASFHLVQAVNLVTAFLVIYFTIPIVLSVFNLLPVTGAFTAFYGFLPGVLLYALAALYKLFPRVVPGAFLNRKMLLHILLYSLVCTLPFTFFPARYFQEFKLVFLICWAFQLFIVTPLSWLVYQQRKDNILRLRGMEQELTRSEADLQMLRSQINPHFLFNVLNTLYGSALMNGARSTAAGIQQLGDMMRFMLHENHLDYISMEREINYLNNYISLQKLRVEATGNMLIEDQIDEVHCNHRIAPMLLIPFVENAFKHGISEGESSWVKIRLRCNEKNIYFEVRNSVHPVVENDPEREKSGIGLRNVQERLRLLYPEKHKLQYGMQGEEFVVHLQLQPVY